MGLGIFWVYFTATGRRGHELKLEIHAVDRISAVKQAEQLAKENKLDWVYNRTEACR